MRSPQQYLYIERTPQRLRCGIGACPAIYEVIEVPPQTRRSGSIGCPSLYLAKNIEPLHVEEKSAAVQHSLPRGTHYFIIGERIEPAEVGLAQKVAPHEALIRVPIGLFANIAKP